MCIKVFNSLSLFLLLIYCHQSLQQQKCSKNELKKLDDLVAKMVTLGDSGRKFPENKTDLIKFSEDNQKLVQMADEIKTKCLSGLSKQVSGIVIYAFKNVLNQLKKTGSKRTNTFLQSFPCMNKGKTGLIKCNDNLIDDFQRAKNADEMLRIPHLCCAYHRTINCGINHLKEVNGCTVVQAENAQNFMQAIFGNALNLICNEYSEETDKCDNLGPAPKKLKSQRKTKSFILPLIDLLSSFPEV